MMKFHITIRTKLFLMLFFFFTVNTVVLVRKKFRENKYNNEKFSNNRFSVNVFKRPNIIFTP